MLTKLILASLTIILPIIGSFEIIPFIWKSNAHIFLKTYVMACCLGFTVMLSVLAYGIALAAFEQKRWGDNDSF